MTVSEKKGIVEPASLSGPKFGVRHWQSLLLFLAATVAYWTRINVSVAVVAMTNKDLTTSEFQHFNWNEKEKSYILSSFFWGYIASQIPAGHIGQWYGTKVMLLLSILCPSILTVITPVCVTYGGWIAFCVLRVLEGFFGGAIFPLFHIHIAKWAPLEERNRIGGFSYSGVQLGTVLAFLSSGMIAASSLGWPGIFYIPGAFGLLWSIFWFFYGANSPEDSKSISSVEKKYIEAFSESSQQSSTQRIPWISIFTSIPFLALITTRMSHAWGSSTLLTEIPAYMSHVLKQDMKSNAIFSALPYAAMFILSYLFLLIADITARNGCASLTVIRKTFNTIAEWGPALGLTGLAFVTSENLPLAITLLTVSVSISSASVLGSGLNHIDLSPNHAGILMGIANSLANVISIIVPLVVGAIVTNAKDHSQWQIIFFIAAGVYFCGNLVYIIFGKMEKQPWNDPESKEVDRRPSVFVEAAPNVIS